MDDKGMAFEERKVVNKEQGREYSRGGGGGPAGFFSIKTNVFSRQCYSDPNNPGRMICKEVNNQSGFDPFNQDNNYKKIKENVYTHELQDQNLNTQVEGSESMFKKM